MMRRTYGSGGSNACADMLEDIKLTPATTISTHVLVFVIFQDSSVSSTTNSHL